MRPLGLAMILAGAAASLATSAPDDRSRVDAGPEPRRNWLASSERLEHQHALAAEADLGFLVRARFDGDLRVFAEDHRASIGLEGRAAADGAAPPTLRIEARNLDGSIIAAEARRGHDDVVRVSVPFPTETCARDARSSCELEFEVWISLADVAATVDWSARLSAGGLLAAPAIVELSAELATEPR